MNFDEIREEISKYVQVLETNYTEAIKDQRTQNEILKKKIRKIVGAKADSVSVKNEFETLFLEAIDEVKKDLVRRKLRNEINQKHKGLQT